MGFRAGRIVLAFVMVVAFPLSSAVPNAAAATVRNAPSWQECANSLGCTIAQLDRMSMGDRLRLVRAFQRGPAQRFERGFARWNVIEAVIQLFVEHGMGAPGTWASYTDAAIVEGIQRGLALAGGRSGGDHGNPGARMWARYLTDLRAGRLKEKATHNAAWGNAEQASTEWGILPVNNPGTPTVPELTLFAASESYRRTLRSEPITRPLLRALDQPRVINCYDWLTDVTNRKPIRDAGTVILRLSRTPGDPQVASDVLTGLATTYPECTRGARH